MSLLNQIDSEGKMSAAECLELRVIRDDVTRFDAMLANPAMFEANSPDMDAEDYIALHESFDLLEPMEERWGKWVSWKCMCESFFSNVICGLGHSTLMALLMALRRAFFLYWWHAGYSYEEVAWRYASC